ITNNHTLATNKAVASILNNNYVWEKSKVYNSVELAGVAKINFPLTSNERTDVELLASEPIIQTLRDQYEADIVVLFVPDNQYGKKKGEAKAIAKNVAKFQDAYALVSFGLS